MAPAALTNLPRPFGPYELVRHLAVGGMAEVYLARARSVAGFEKVVALKTIHSRFSEDPEFARLLVNEANLTAQLSHRNIVQVIDLGQIDDTHYIAMEYVDGFDLARLLQKLSERGEVCPARVAAFIVREVCDGLEHAHRKCDPEGRPLKIVHRDVSPPNVLLSSSGEVKLTDFGIAKAAQRASSTEAGVVKGKYAYMSPEQVRGGAVDPRSDVFSAGCVLYEIATGRPVYKEAPLPVLLDRVSKARFEAPERAHPGLPKPLVAVIKKALAARPEDRYPTARAMADDLNNVLFAMPPNPENELAELVSSMVEGTRASVPPVPGMIFEAGDEEDDSTQIESMAMLRQKMAQPSLRPPPARNAFADDEPTRTIRSPERSRAPMASASARPASAAPTVQPPARTIDSLKPGPGMIDDDDLDEGATIADATPLAEMARMAPGAPAIGAKSTGLPRPASLPRPAAPRPAAGVPAPRPAAGTGTGTLPAGSLQHRAPLAPGVRGPSAAPLAPGVRAPSAAPLAPGVRAPSAAPLAPGVRAPSRPPVAATGPASVSTPGVRAPSRPPVGATGPVSPRAASAPPSAPVADAASARALSTPPLAPPPGGFAAPTPAMPHAVPPLAGPPGPSLPRRPSSETAPHPVIRAAVGQPRSVIFAAAFAALAVITLIVVLLTTR